MMVNILPTPLISNIFVFNPTTSSFMILGGSELYQLYSLARMKYGNIVLLWFKGFLVYLSLGGESVLLLQGKAL